MITGDHPQTAKAFAKEIGFRRNPIVVTASEAEQKLLEQFIIITVLYMSLPELPTPEIKGDY